MTGTLDLRTALQLGRVSNLPTVWTNVLAGAALSGGLLSWPAILATLIAMSLMYVGGMYLNDAFDAEIDARERPDRPIPSGRVSRGTVMRVGFGMLGLGIFVLAVVSLAAAVVGLLLAGAIVFYNWHHKGNPLSPLVMGICRMLVYVGAGYALTSSPDLALLLAALVAVGYLIGLTYIAKQETLSRVENLWPLLFLAVPVIYMAQSLTRGALPTLLLIAFAGWIVYGLSFLFRSEGRSIPRAVVSLIAGISLLDALFLATAQGPALALVAVLCFALTLALQRWIKGT
jgi:4-hydroxybenzoate polyprenyltransferase